MSKTQKKATEKSLNEMTVEELEKHLDKAQSLLAEKKISNSIINNLTDLYNDIYGVDKEMPSVTVTLPLTIYLYTVKGYKPLNENMVKINEDLLNKGYIYDYVLDEVWRSTEVQEWYKDMIKKSNLLEKEINKHAKRLSIPASKIYSKLFTQGFDKYLGKRSQ